MTKYFEGIGRRKTSTARVRLQKGKAENTVNGQPLSDRYAKAEIDYILKPIRVAKLKGYYFTAQTQGGGTTGQKDAIRLGLARAIVKMDKTHKPALRKADLVTRDPRMVERKKVNHLKARKSPQFSKR